MAFEDRNANPFINSGSSIEPREPSQFSESPTAPVGYEVKAIKELTEKLACFKFCKDQLVRPQYGLIDSQFLPDEHRRVSDHFYFGLYESEALSAVLRLIPGVDLSKFPNLLPTISDSLRNHRNLLCNVGIFSREASAEVQSKLFHQALKLAVWHCRLRGFAAIVSQVPVQEVSNYKRLGFILAGKPVQSEGWTLAYVPMILELP